MKILFYKPKTIMGRLVKLFSPLVLGKKVKYSHIGMQLDDYHILDINSGKNSLIRHIKTNSKDFIVLEIHLSTKQKSLVYEAVLKYLDKDYDYLKAVGLRGNINKYTCYELVNVILYDIGYLNKMYEMEVPEQLIKIINNKEKN